MKKLLPLSGIALLVALFAFVFSTGTASAHGHRMVSGYTFIVVFLDEPAYAGLKNGLDLTLCKGDCQYTVTDGTRVIANPVNDADKTLKAEVISGAAAALPLTLEARYGQPGKYAGYFMPTRAGDHTFHIFGTLEGKQIDEKFTSSKDGFEGIGTISQYPAGESANSSATEVNALKSQVNDLRNSQNTAIIVGIAGLVVGALGLTLAGFALVRRSHATVTGDQEKVPADSLRG